VAGVGSGDTWETILGRRGGSIVPVDVVRGAKSDKENGFSQSLSDAGAWLAEVAEKL
jgi:hypothetical protein